LSRCPYEGLSYHNPKRLRCVTHTAFCLSYVNCHSWWSKNDRVFLITSNYTLYHTESWNLRFNGNINGLIIKTLMVLLLYYQMLKWIIPFIAYWIIL
jgi:hypothetical protein